MGARKTRKGSSVLHHVVALTLILSGAHAGDDHLPWNTTKPIQLTADFVTQDIPRESMVFVTLRKDKTFRFFSKDGKFKDQIVDVSKRVEVVFFKYSPGETN